MRKIILKIIITLTFVSLVISCGHVDPTVVDSNTDEDSVVDSNTDDDSVVDDSCPEGYIKENNECINSKMVMCDADNNNPINSTDILDNVEVTYSIESWSIPGKCEWNCESEFLRKDEKCVFEWSSVAIGNQYSCGIKKHDNTLYCWGDLFANIGEDVTHDKYFPKKVDNKEWSFVSIGKNHTCAIVKSTNNLYCWGKNDKGQLGDGTTSDKTAPNKIDDEQWSYVSTGRNHTCAIMKNTNHLYCWGGNEYGEVGDGTTANVYIPKKINDDEWKSISLSANHSCGIKNNTHNLYCWGSNMYSQLGYGKEEEEEEVQTIIDPKVPNMVDENRWSSVASGHEHTCAIMLSDSKLYCWGSNYTNQLGAATIDEGDITSIPTKVNDESWNSVVAGFSHTCAIRKNGNKIYCWGYSGDGQLGVDGEGKTPLKISDDSWTSISAYSGSSCAIRDGENFLYCWGGNNYGEMGSGDESQSNIPTIVVGPQ